MTPKEWALILLILVYGVIFWLTYDGEEWPSEDEIKIPLEDAYVEDET